MSDTKGEYDPRKNIVIKKRSDKGMTVTMEKYAGAISRTALIFIYAWLSTGVRCRLLRS